MWSLPERAAGNNPAANTVSVHGSQAANSDTPSSAQSTHFTTQTTNSTTKSANSSTLRLPQQLIDQLTAYLQQHRNPPVGNQASYSGNIIDDDNLPVASGPTHTNVSVPAQVVRLITSLSVVKSITSLSIPHYLLSLGPHYLQQIPAVTILPPLANPTRTPLPIIPTRIRNKMARGEYIDFAFLSSTAIFGAQTIPCLSSQ